MSVQRFRLKVGDTIETFEMGTQADVTLRDFILLEQETRDLGQAFTMGDIVRLAEKFHELTPDQAKHDPEGAWQLAATIWLAMVRKARQAGDLKPVPFAAAIDVDLSTFEPIPDPEDHRPGKARKRPPASGQGAKRGARKASAAV